MIESLLRYIVVQGLPHSVDAVAIYYFSRLLGYAGFGSRDSQSRLVKCGLVLLSGATVIGMLEGAENMRPLQTGLCDQPLDAESIIWAAIMTLIVAALVAWQPNFLLRGSLKPGKGSSTKEGEQAPPQEVPPKTKKFNYFRILASAVGGFLLLSGLISFASIIYCFAIWLSIHASLPACRDVHSVSSLPRMLTLNRAGCCLVLLRVIF